MKTYRFPFDAVLRVRALHRDEQRLRLTDAYRAEEIVEQQRQQLSEEMATLQNQQREAMRRQELNVNDLLDAQRYEVVMKVRQQTMEKQTAMLAKEVERRRQSVVEAEREVQAMEKLDSRLHAAHHAHEQRADAKQLDEIAQQLATACRG